MGVVPRMFVECSWGRAGVLALIAAVVALATSPLAQLPLVLK